MAISVAASCIICFCFSKSCDTNYDVFSMILTHSHVRQRAAPLKIPFIALREVIINEKPGSGFLTLFKIYHENQLPTPKVIEGTGYVKCILPRPTI